jgi:pantoate--beta-alanine ligase
MARDARMLLTANPDEARRAVRRWRVRGERVAFVPTMGFLHDGHISLVERAARSADRVVASVFVNPMQFGPREDFRSYPRDFARDRRLLARAGVHLLFAPRPDTFTPADNDTRVHVGGLGLRLEGASRPGHFAGVATVVAKLLHTVEPDDLWLGQKDAQQVAVLGRMLNDLDWPVRLRVGPTVREKDGLALSSRNVRLEPAERAEAPLLHTALRAGAAAVREARAARRGARPPALAAAAEKAMRSVLARLKLGRVDYAACVDPATFHRPDDTAKRLLLAVAVRFPSVRLIDNQPLGLGGRR